MRDSQHTLTDLHADSVSVPHIVVRVTPPRGAAIEQRMSVRPLIVGTGPECDLVLADPRVSRRHCAISMDSGGILLEDLGSKNGTLVGDVRIHRAHITDRTKVQIGNSRLVLKALRGADTVQLSRGVQLGDAIGASVAMRVLFAALERAAATDETILLLGESGTGKELLAKGIHDRSARAHQPFVVFDAASVPAGLAESELFGHVRGAFTGATATRPGLIEQAHGGTLFLDEIGELPAQLQPKLLRALEARQVRRLGENAMRSVDIRVVAATHRDLRAQIASGEFRQDLYYRLAVVEAWVPPLRDRRDDIPLLVEHFLRQRGRSTDDLPANAIAMLTAHDWPGNVRELRNTVARLLLFPGQDLPPPSDRTGAGAALPQAPLPQLTDLPLREARDQVIERFERSYVRAKLAETSGNVSKAAEAMGVSRQFLYRLMEKLGLRQREG